MPRGADREDPLPVPLARRYILGGQGGMRPAAPLLSLPAMCRRNGCAIRFSGPIRTWYALLRNRGGNMKTLVTGILGTAALFGQAQPQQKQAPAPMTFFITSIGAGNGANLGGLAGADAHCQKLAQAAGAGNRTWHAYLSTSSADGKPAVNAR